MTASSPLSLAALACVPLICLAVNTDNPVLRWGQEAVLTFSSNLQLWVESRVLLMNYACLDARVLSNTSAIIIETIEKTIPDGSIIRQQGKETWSIRTLPCLPCQPKRHTHREDLYRGTADPPQCTATCVMTRLCECAFVFHSIILGYWLKNK